MVNKYLAFIFIVIFIISGCKKDKLSEMSSKVNEIIIPVNSTKYCKGSGIYDVLCYKDETDIGKTMKSIIAEKKDYFMLSMGHKVTVIHEKKINEVQYAKIKLPDDSEYWIESSFLTDKFAVVNKTDLLCYKQPDENYVLPGIKLQPGDFGYIEEYKNEWVKVDFRSYRSANNSEMTKNSWVGKVWIKSGFTEDINAAKQGYYLYLSYYYEIVKSDKVTALEMVTKAESITSGIVTDIDAVVKDRLVLLSPVISEAPSSDDTGEEK